MGRRGREQELLETVKELEEGLLDTIEALNAAVEARDPYTAGHSQRVRRVALAAGRALDLSQDRLDLLALAALFHDIGKIGMPDSILTKHDLLTRDEAALMREHFPLFEERSQPFATITNAGMDSAIPMVSLATRSRSRRRSSASPKPGMR